MSEATLETPTNDPLRELIDGWSRTESQRVEELQRLLEPIEQAVGQLSEWADRAADAEQAEAELRQQVETREQAADDRRRRLEHDLKLSRLRVVELERSLQERTEELLRVQASNNELAAQLQEIGEDEPLDADLGLIEQRQAPGEPSDGDLMAIASENDGCAEILAAAEELEGVTERFARLRRS